jgi:hypothetical protein
MKDDPLLIRKLPPTALIKHAVEVWPNRPDPESVVASQIHAGAQIWVRTWRGVKHRRVRVMHVARGFTRHAGRRFIVADDRTGLCHTYWLTDVIHVQPRRRELTR